MTHVQVGRYRVLVRLLYLLAFVRTSLQTECIAALSDLMHYNEGVDKLYDNLVQQVRTDAKGRGASHGALCGARIQT